MPSSKNAVVLVVITFLLVMLIHSSFLKSHLALAYYCEPTNSAGITTKCCDDILGNDGKYHTYCTFCDNTNPPSHCSPRFQVTRVNPPPPPITNKQPSSPRLPTNALSPSSTGNNTEPPTNNNTSMAPTLSITKEHNLASPKLYNPPSQKQQTLTTTCPNGLPPDANGNCPTSLTTTTNQQGGSASNNNNPTSGHHKGSNQPTQIGGGGQESTVTKKHKASKTDQGTTQSPS